MMASVDQFRKQALQSEIHRLEQALAQSPDDAFGYLELGCLFAEADQRDQAIEAFRSSYRHRTGGAPMQPGTGPLITGHLREAFEVAVNQAPQPVRSKTRRLFEEAIHQAEKAETASIIDGFAAVAFLVLVVLAAFSAPTIAAGVQGFWPPDMLQQTIREWAPGSGGYWPQYRPF